MASNIPLNNLIEALAGAVIEAQDNIEQHQLNNLMRYFGKDRRPKSLVMRVPSIRPDAEEGECDLYRAPLLPLMSTNMLKIKDVEITFDAELGQVESETADEDGDRKSNQQAKRISVDIAGTQQDKASSVHVILRVEGSEPSDGAARLMNHLTQTQGVFRKG